MVDPPLPAALTPVRVFRSCPIIWGLLTKVHSLEEGCGAGVVIVYFGGSSPIMWHSLQCKHRVDIGTWLSLILFKNQNVVDVARFA